MSTATRRVRRVRESRRRSGPARVARKGMRTLARLVRLVTGVLVGIVVAGILLVVFEANRSNEVVNALLDAARFLAGPFDGMFSAEGRKATVAVNWGIAAAVYAVVGSLIARLLRR